MLPTPKAVDMFTRRRVAAGMVLAAALALALLLSPAAVVATVRWTIHSPWFPLVLIGLYLLRPFVAWPISLLSALVGFRYGIGLGLPIALVGAVATSLPPYLAARSLAVDGDLLTWLTDGSERYFATVGDLRGLVAARLAPTPAEATSSAAGAAGVSLPAFVLGTAVGELPWTVAAVVAGTQLARFDPGAISLDIRIVVGAAVLAAVLLVGPTYRYVGRRTTDR